jgi:3-hydroxyisobutyrate dehydrogenase-like beta-hydroxyacid dehydrogenase
MRVGVVGLGTMGAPMARHLVNAGFTVTVHNRTRSREEPLERLGAQRAESPGEAAVGADAVLTCVSDGPDLEEIVLGSSGIAETLMAGAVLVDCSTVAPSVARRVAEALEGRRAHFVDAPVSGGSEGAERGTLTVFCGGSDAAVARARPVLESFSRSVTHLGPAGAGQAAKAVNQMVIAGTYAALAEGIAYAERAGLPLEPLVEALGGGAADSWVLRNRSANMIGSSYPLGFRTALHLKDLRIAVAEAEAAGLDPAVCRLVVQQEEALVERGLGDEDVSNLARYARGETA